MTAIVIPEGHTRAGMLACVERELRLRERSYPRWVELGRMSTKKMDEEIATMKAVLAVIAHLPGSPPAQTGLFGSTR